MREAFEWLRELTILALPAAGTALFILILAVAFVYTFKNICLWFDQEVRYSEGWVGWLVLKLLALIVGGIIFIVVMFVFIGNEVLDLIDRVTPVIAFLGGGS